MNVCVCVCGGGIKGRETYRMILRPHRLMQWIPEGSFLRGEAEGMHQADVFWVVTPCIVVGGYQRFGATCCLHIQGENSKFRAGKRI
jgi:hypothetical protein